MKSLLKMCLVLGLFYHEAIIGQEEFTDFPNDRLIENERDSVVTWIKGNWMFVAVLDMKHKQVEASTAGDPHEYFGIQHYRQRNYSFEPNLFYSFSNTQRETMTKTTTPPRGTWNYNHHAGEIELYPITSHLRDPSHYDKEEIDWLLDEGIVYPFRHYTLKIEEINPTDLYIIVNQLYSEDYIESFILHYRKSN